MLLIRLSSDCFPFLNWPEYKVPSRTQLAFLLFLPIDINMPLKGEMNLLWTERAIVGVALTTFVSGHREQPNRL